MNPTADDAELLAKGWTRETSITRDEEGRWFQDGVRLEHPRLERAFDRWIGVAEDGRYCLRNSIHWVYVTLRGAPLFVRAVEVRGGDLVARFSDDREEAVDLDTLRTGPDGALYCSTHGGGAHSAKMDAKFDRAAMLALSGAVREDSRGVFLQIGDRVVRPPNVAEPLTPSAARSEAP